MTKWMPTLFIALACCVLPLAASADPMPGESTSPSAAGSPAPAVAATLAPTPAPAAGLTTAGTPAPIAGGWRQRLQASGVTLRADYLSEIAANTSGGKQRGSAYAQQVRVGADLDLGKLAGYTGTFFHLTLNDRVGNSVSNLNLGNKLGVQEIFGAGQNFRLGEASFDKTINKVNVKVGWYAWGNDYGLTGLLCNFENSGFCGHPQSLPNSAGWSDYPIAKWSLRIRDNPSKELYIETGAFEVNPAGGAAANGFNLSFVGATGVIYPLEIGWLPGQTGKGLPGEYKVGTYYDASHVSDVASSKKLVSGRTGFYVLASQMVARNHGRPGGLWLFADATTHDPATAIMKYYLDGGFVFTAPFAGRNLDSFSVGYVRAAVNPRALNARFSPSVTLPAGEAVLEASYGIGLSRSVVIRPDVQYVMKPGAFAFRNIPNAFIYAFETKVTL
jgi:porin